jgi:hypothetical protein
MTTEKIMDARPLMVAFCDLDLGTQWGLMVLENALGVRIVMYEYHEFGKGTDIEFMKECLSDLRNAIGVIVIAVPRWWTPEANTAVANRIAAVRCPTMVIFDGEEEDAATRQKLVPWMHRTSISLWSYKTLRVRGVAQRAAPFAQMIGKLKERFGL